MDPGLLEDHPWRTMARMIVEAVGGKVSCPGLMDGMAMIAADSRGAGAHP